MDSTRIEASHTGNLVVASRIEASHTGSLVAASTLNYHAWNDLNGK